MSVVILVLMSTAFVLAFCLTGLLLNYAKKASLLDIPNERSSHTVPTPRGGGLATVITFMAGIMVMWRAGMVSTQVVQVVVPAGVLVAVVGFFDDHQHLPARIRLSVHTLAAIVSMFFMTDFPVIPLFRADIFMGPWSYCFVLLALIWGINLHNFMDGIDGIAAVETISVCGGAAIILFLNEGDISYIYLLLLLVVATGGFLIWNWPPAKIFMGDSCSGFLGIFIGIIALLTSADGMINIWTWLILYGIFIIDATYTLFIRMVSGQRFVEAHRSHTYQILSRRFNSHKIITLGVLGINIFWLFPLAVVSSRYPVYAIPCMLTAFAPLIVVAVRLGAGRINQ